MGNYLTNAELKTRFEDDAEAAFFTNDEASGVPTDAKLTDIVETAEGMIDSALAVRYATPVDVSVDTTLAALLKRQALDLAEGLMIGGRSERLSDAKQAQIDRVLEWCEKIAKGERVLPGAVTPAGPTSRDPRASWSDHGRTLITASERSASRSTMSKL